VRLVIVVLLGLIALGFSTIAVGVLGLLTPIPRLSEGYTLVPAPWLVPKQPGGSTLRLAMVHDVLHERFYVHGEAWFRHRHTKVERALAPYEDGTKAKDDHYFSLLDDLAVDFDRLGRPADGVPILRHKLDLQQPPGPDGERPPPDKAFYTTYANLGTLLAHVHLKGALAKDPAALAGLHEGLAFIEQSMRVNPDAHFGRETWQAVTLRYLIATARDPKLVTTVDVTGMRWDRIGSKVHIAGLHGRRELLSWFHDGTFERLRGAERTPQDTRIAQRIRDMIPRFSTNPDGLWSDHVTDGVVEDAIPFDEPTLAFVGIWTLGSGANPHFALAFAHLMEHLGQDALAWSAYERTCDLAPRFSPDAGAQKLLTDHCRSRQPRLELRLKEPADTLRRRHQAELAFGRAEQQAYQRYEAERIAAGQDPGAPDFYADFFRGRAPIASDPGNADTFVMVDKPGIFDALLITQAIACSLAVLVLLTRMATRMSQPTA
jgi:hypothetical protein